MIHKHSRYSDEWRELNTRMRAFWREAKSKKPTESKKKDIFPIVWITKEVISMEVLYLVHSDINIDTAAACFYTTVSVLSILSSCSIISFNKSNIIKYRVKLVSPRLFFVKILKLDLLLIKACKSAP